MAITCEQESHGVKLLLPNHKKIRQLKKDYAPSNHGHKPWPSSWMLIDFLHQTESEIGLRVLELGCGWGLSGIYCAKNLRSPVTSVDSDPEVSPFVKLLADTNGVTVDFHCLDIDRIRRKLLKKIDVVIASDICFCDTMIDPIRRFILRAQKAAVKKVIISDPGRWPFDDLCEILDRKRGVELQKWRTTHPVKIDGSVLSILF